MWCTSCITQGQGSGTVRDLPASHCMQSIKSSEAEADSWGSAETWPRNTLFSFSTVMSQTRFCGWWIWWTVAVHTLPRTYSAQKVRSEAECCKKKWWRHSELYIAGIVIGRKRKREGHPFAARQVYQPLNHRNFNVSGPCALLRSWKQDHF